MSAQVRGDRWVSYDDEHSVRLKAEFAFDKKLGGVMVWSVETDDFKVCGLKLLWKSPNDCLADLCLCRASAVTGQSNTRC